MTRWITCIADLHGRTPAVRRDSYLVLLAGDLCPDGGRDRQRDWLHGPFTDWLRGLPGTAVAVPGNHDLVLQDYLPGLPNCHLSRSFELLQVAGLRIITQPLVLDGGAFRGTEEDIEAGLGRAAASGAGAGEIDVVLSHNPPLGILDLPSRANHLGSLALRYFCWKQQPALCVFGHVHEGRGWRHVAGTCFVNATLGAGCDGTGWPVPALHPPWGLADNSWRHK